ncbi:MAG: tautomerase family protein [Beijerinckiaceae bacterium]
MPLVRISIPTTVSRERQLALSNAVHDTMVETINVPAADRFQIITRHDADDLVMDPTFPDVQRAKESAIVHITLRGGRTNDQKRALYAGITARSEAAGAFSKADVMIVLSENNLIDWSFGGGVAHYMREG